MRSVQYRLGSSTERLRGLQRGPPITRRYSGTLCELCDLLLSLLEDGYALLHVPHVGFERVQRCDHQCLDDRWRACFACHGGSLWKTLLSRGWDPTRLRCGSAIRYGCLSQGGMDTSGLDLVALPIIGLHTYAPPSCQPVVVNKCIHCTNVYYQNAQGGTTTMCRDLRREEEDAVHSLET